jgi:hypothetical protein
MHTSNLARLLSFVALLRNTSKLSPSSARVNAFLLLEEALATTAPEAAGMCVPYSALPFPPRDEAAATERRGATLAWEVTAPAAEVGDANLAKVAALPAAAMMVDAIES